jgi:glucoamylase
MPRPRVILPLLFALLIGVLGPRPAVLVVGASHPAQRSIPANPVAQTTPTPNWLPADKQGFGTSRTLASKVWFTLEGGGLSEVYYPRLDTPSFRDLQFAVDGVPESGGSVHQVTLADPSSLTYRQVSTDAPTGGA